ncbi:hypothetical protein A3K80_07405 [Candidatus Bathyarchaeota archaeon RBG_13_38_9]|nr:MAG: hypothetical protein A3K80_07405 [Candidatus Bathyarchaeota archaeon RBG_13_38_9]
MGLENPTIAKEIVRASGPTPLANEFTKDFFDSLTDVNGQLMGTGGLEYLRKMKEIAPAFLTSNQRSAFDIFARNAQIATLGQGQTPITSIIFRGAYIGMSITSGLVAGNLSGSAGTGLIAAAAIPKIRKELANLMLNPANARLAARLPRLKPGTPESLSIMRKLFKTALRGVRFDIQDAAGQSLGLFEAQSDGRLHSVTMNPLTGPPLNVTWE